MINKDFIDEIVTEVYKRLEQNCSPRKRIGILGPLDHNQLQPLNQHYDLVEELKDCQVYLITKMTFSMLARLALGLPGNQQEEIILVGLLQGKKVYLLEQGIELEQFKDTSYKNLYLLYQDYLSKLKLFGIQIIQHISMIEETVSEPVDQYKGNERARYQIGKDVSSTNHCFDLSMKKVLLEVDLKNYHLQNNATIILDKKCIITPLAEDYIKLHMISVQKK